MHRWKFSLLATAAALSTGLYITDANALTLGRVTVQSALGEPLRAQVALPNITPAEADSLHVSIASPDVFRAQGLEFSPAVNGIHLELKRGAGGAMVLQMNSNNAVNDPFIDIVIDAAWNAGHLVRSYTLLFDPPALRSTPAPAPVAPQTSSSPAVAAPVRTPSVSAAPAVRAPAVATHGTAQPSGKEVSVQAGDTAGAIASAHRPSGISLDQMLVAMVRANPHAFIEGNVNRLRAGSVLQLPSKEEAQATPAAEARQIIATQSQDFNAYRRRLAGAAPEAAVQAASRSASGKVQTEVAEDKPTAKSADKLTLSKGSAARQTADAKTAQAKQAEDDAARLKELSKNIEDLKNVSQGTEPASAPAPQAAEQTPPASGAAGSSPAPPAAATPAPEPAAAPATTPAVPVAPPAESVKPKEPPKSATPAVAAPAPVPEPSLLGSLTEQPMLAGGALALVLLMLGWGGYRWKRSRRNAQGPEATFADDADHPDSFFAESGGQEVDTTSSDLTTGSTSPCIHRASSTRSATWIRWPRRTSTSPTGKTRRPRPSSRKQRCNTRSRSPLRPSLRRSTPNGRIAWHSSPWPARCRTSPAARARSGSACARRAPSSTATTRSTSLPPRRRLALQSRRPGPRSRHRHPPPPTRCCPKSTSTWIWTTAPPHCRLRTTHPRRPQRAAPSWLRPSVRRSTRWTSPARRTNSKN